MVLSESLLFSSVLRVIRWNISCCCAESCILYHRRSMHRWFSYISLLRPHHTLLAFIVLQSTSSRCEQQQQVPPLQFSSSFREAAESSSSRSSLTVWLCAAGSRSTSRTHDDDHWNVSNSYHSSFLWFVCRYLSLYSSSTLFFSLPSPLLSPAAVNASLMPLSKHWLHDVFVGGRLSLWFFVFVTLSTT